MCGRVVIELIKESFFSFSLAVGRAYSSSRLLAQDAETTKIALRRQVPVNEEAVRLKPLKRLEA